MVVKATTTQVDESSHVHNVECDAGVRSSKRRVGELPSRVSSVSYVASHLSSNEVLISNNDSLLGDSCAEKNYETDS